MNKSDICKQVHEKHGGLSYAETQAIVDFIFDTIKGRLARGEKVLLSGFGSFDVQQRQAKVGVNPQTGEPVTIPGRNAVKFTPSKYLKTLG